MDTTVVALVVGVRFIAPLFILRFPLPAILVCLVADAIDQTIFQAVIGGDLSWYQSYDKAFDVYYLSFAFISTLTNWRDENAFQVSRILFFWRLVGVVLFELTTGGSCCCSSPTRSSTSSSPTRRSAPAGALSDSPSWSSWRSRSASRSSSRCPRRCGSTCSSST